MNLLIKTPEEVTIQNLEIRGETGSLEETAMREALGKGHCSGWTEWHIPPSSSTLKNGNPTGEQKVPEPVRRRAEITQYLEQKLPGCSKAWRTNRDSQLDGGME